MGEFLGSDVGQKSFLHLIRHRIPLGQVAHRGSDFAVRTAILAHYILRDLRIRRLDIDWIL